MFQERYTWWAQRSKTSKINNTGWRIDYWSQVTVSLTRWLSLIWSTRELAKTIHLLSWRLNSKRETNGLSSCHSWICSIWHRKITPLLLQPARILCRIRASRGEISSSPLEDCQLMLEEGRAEELAQLTHPFGRGVNISLALQMFLSSTKNCWKPTILFIVP